MATVSLEEAIQRNNRAFEVALDRGDAAGMAAAYTESGQALPPNGEVASGRATIQRLWQGVIDMGVQGATLETVELQGYGDMAYEVGRATLRGAGGTVLDRVKYIVIWQQEAGQWKWHRDIWNSSPSP
jgi:ketosteroid isomerase-like protein